MWARPTQTVFVAFGATTVHTAAVVGFRLKVEVTRSKG